MNGGRPHVTSISYLRPSYFTQVIIYYYYFFFIAHTVLSNILFYRLEPCWDEKVGEYQEGFRAGRSAIDQIR